MNFLYNLKQYSGRGEAIFRFGVKDNEPLQMRIGARGSVVV
jgi:hypothetical protein